MLSGEVDGVYGAPVGSLATLPSSAAGKLCFGPSTETVSLGPAASSGPAADPKIRAALDLAIDKNTLITSVLKGAGTPLKTFTPPMAWAGSPARIATTGYLEVPGALYYAPGFVLKDGTFNWTGYSDPAVTQHIGAAVSATDPASSAKEFVAAQAIYAPAGLQITLAESYNRLFLGKRVHEGVARRPAGIGRDR